VSFPFSNISFAEPNCKAR